MAEIGSGKSLIENVKLVKAEKNDEDFLAKVFFSARKVEFSMLGWGDEQLRSFLSMQYNFQKQSYCATVPDAENSIIWYGNKKAGRLLVDRNADEITLVDIALLEEFRGLGIGSEIILDLVNEAGKRNIPLRLHGAIRNEGALRLYKKLGFQITGTDQVNHSMEWRPELIS